MESPSSLQHWRCLSLISPLLCCEFFSPFCPDSSKGLWVTDLSRTSFLFPNRAGGYIKHLCFWLSGVWIWPTVASAGVFDLQFKLPYFRSIACVLYRFLCWGHVGCVSTSATVDISAGFCSLELYGRNVVFHRQGHAERIMTAVGRLLWSVLGGRSPTSKVCDILHVYHVKPAVRQFMTLPLEGLLYV